MRGKPPVRAPVLAALLVAAILAIVYARLSPPGQIEVTTDSFDVPEAATVPPVLGILHPTGYALYTLLGRVATWKLSVLAPALEPARAMNLLSAVLAGLAGGAALLLFGSGATTMLAALPAVFLFFLGDTMLPYATVSSVYPLHALLTSLVLTLALAGFGGNRGKSETGDNRETDENFVTGENIGSGKIGNGGGSSESGARYRLASAWFAGLLVTHHPSGVLILPGWAVLFAGGALREGRFRRDVIFGAGFALAAASVVLFLPIRDAADPPVSPHGGLASIGALSDYLSGKTFHHLFDFSRPGVLVRARAALGWVVRDWTPAGLLLALWGLVALLRTRPLAAVALVLVLAGNFSVSSGYKLEKVFIYYVPSHLAIGALAAQGLSDLLRAFPSPGSRRAVAGALAAIVLLLGVTRAAKWDRSRDDRLPRYAADVMKRVKPDATIVAWDSFYWALRYRQLVHGERPDVTVDYVEGLRPSIETAMTEMRPAYYVPPTREGRWLRHSFRLVEIPILSPADTTVQGTFLPATSLVEVLPPADTAVGTNTAGGMGREGGVAGAAGGAGAGGMADTTQATAEARAALRGLARRFLRATSWHRAEVAGAKIAPREDGAALVFEGSYDTPSNDYAEFVMEIRRGEFSHAGRIVVDYDLSGAGTILFLWLKERDPHRYARYALPLRPGEGRTGAFDLTLPEKSAGGFDLSRAATLHWILDDDPDASTGMVSLRIRGIRAE